MSDYTQAAYCLKNRITTEVDLGTGNSTGLKTNQECPHATWSFASGTLHHGLTSNLPGTTQDENAD